MLLVIDNFLKSDDPMLSAIQSDHLWEYNRAKFTFMESHQPAGNIWERMAKKIWESVSPHGVLPPQYAGIEYWANEYSMEGDRQHLGWHSDKDEHLFDTTRITKSPYVGSVYYCHRTLPADSYLEIRRGEGDNNIERVQPVPNRLVIFNSSVQHCVTPITAGLRRGFATNIWIDKPSEENFV